MNRCTPERHERSIAEHFENDPQASRSKGGRQKLRRDGKLKGKKSHKKRVHETNLMLEVPWRSGDCGTLRNRECWERERSVP